MKPPKIVPEIIACAALLASVLARPLQFAASLRAPGHESGANVPESHAAEHVAQCCDRRHGRRREVASMISVQRIRPLPYRST